MESDDYHFKFKVLIIGDKGVGKTSLLDCKLLSYLAITQAFGKIVFS
jgi:GTPase SAR1 family protein